LGEPPAKPQGSALILGSSIFLLKESKRKDEAKNSADQVFPEGQQADDSLLHFSHRKRLA